MKKAERLVQEISYLDNHHYFNLKDLMHEFGISKRTALRDLLALEEMGLAIYSELGKYGGYHLLNKEPLIPINFTSSEISAIFFAIDALRLLTSNPFQQSYPQIAKRLLNSLPGKQRKVVNRIEEAVDYYRIPTVHHNDLLHQLLEAILGFKLVRFRAKQADKIIQEAQLRRLLYRSGNWFVEGIDVKTNKFFRYRCDLLVQYEKLPKDAPYTFDEFDHCVRQEQKNKQKVNFECELTMAGCEHFLKNHYPGMELKGHRLIGTYIHEEYQYLLTYLLSYGSEIKVLAPAQLRRDYVQRLREIISWYD